MSTLGDATDVNPVIKFLPHTVNHVTFGARTFPTMPRDLPQLRRRIAEAVAAIDRHMLQRVWQDLDYETDICRVTKGGHIEHL
jgi:paraquat-inducible protein B